jgi:hypothetical protein
LSKEFVICCDESDSNGKYYSNFYGGVLVQSIDLDHVKSKISAKKAELHLHGEVNMKHSQLSQQVHGWAALNSAYTTKILRRDDATCPGFALSLIGYEPRQVTRLTGNKKGNASVYQQRLRQKFREKTWLIEMPNGFVRDRILRTRA